MVDLPIWALVLGIYGVVSTGTLVVFGWDKWAARRQARRTPERTLHTWSMLGGWPGAMVAMQLFRHKRRKRPFVRTVWAIAGVHLAIWIGLAAWFFFFRE